MPRAFLITNKRYKCAPPSHPYQPCGGKIPDACNSQTSPDARHIQSTHHNLPQNKTPLDSCYRAAGNEDDDEGGAVPAHQSPALPSSPASHPVDLMLTPTKSESSPEPNAHLARDVGVYPLPDETTTADAKHLSPTIAINLSPRKSSSKEAKVDKNESDKSLSLSVITSHTEPLQEGNVSPASLFSDAATSSPPTPESQGELTPQQQVPCLDEQAKDELRITQTQQTLLYPKPYKTDLKTIHGQSSIREDFHTRNIPSQHPLLALSNHLRDDDSRFGDVRPYRTDHEVYPTHSFGSLPYRLPEHYPPVHMDRLGGINDRLPIPGEFPAAPYFPFNAPAGLAPDVRLSPMKASSPSMSPTKPTSPARMSPMTSPLLTRTPGSTSIWPGLSTVFRFADQEPVNRLMSCQGRMGMEPNVAIEMDRGLHSPGSCWGDDDEDEDGEDHPCPDCGKTYSTSSNLARHRQTHRSVTDKKARKCPHCEKVYVSMPAYSMHVRTHSQGCECAYCGKRFSRPWLLQGHIRTHTGEKPFGCPQCGKSFADKSNLRAHIQTHSSEKPYVCGRCGKAFALKSYLYKHEESSCMRGQRTMNRPFPH